MRLLGLISGPRVYLGLLDFISGELREGSSDRGSPN